MEYQMEWQKKGREVQGNKSQSMDKTDFVDNLPFTVPTLFLKTQVQLQLNQHQPWCSQQQTYSQNLYNLWCQHWNWQLKSLGRGMHHSCVSSACGSFSTSNSRAVSASIAFNRYMHAVESSIQPVTATKSVPAMLSTARPSAAMQSSAIAIQPVSAMLMSVTEQATTRQSWQPSTANCHCIYSHCHSTSFISAHRPQNLVPQHMERYEYPTCKPFEPIKYTLHKEGVIITMLEKHAC